MTLAVATQNPSATAETYVRQHMRLIRPGETVGIALDCTGAPYAEIPMFCVRRSVPGLMRKLGSVFALVRTGYSAAISPSEEVRLSEFLRTHRTTAVLAEFGTTGSALRAFCRRQGLPLFVNFHGHDATVLGRRRDIRFAYRLLSRDAEKIICGSRHFAGTLERLGILRSKIEIIPCGIELGEFGAMQRRNPDLIVAVGRMTRKKRPDLAIRAFAIARRDRPSLRLEMIGDGPERKTCEAVVRELGLGEYIKLLGAQPHDVVKARLSNAAMFLQHSVTAENGDQESQGVSLLEAMASSLPVVVTDHNGFSETVVHGQTGLLSPEGDADAMAANIVRVAGDPDLARAMGERGRAKVEEEFDAVRLAGRLRTLLFGAKDASEAAAHVRLGAGA